MLALTDCKIDKVGQLQLLVMNLQIDLIRSLRHLSKDISVVLSSPRMQKVYVSVDDEMRIVAKELIEVSF